ncbi:MAG: DUF6941 family protein [Chloroflexota bacterium]
MQPVIKAALLCDYALTSEDGKLSVVGIFSNINFPNLPNAYARFFVVYIITLDVGTHDVQIGIVDPVGQQMLPEPPAVQVNVEAPNADTNLVIDFNNLPFQRSGVHQVQLLLAGRLTHTIRLNVQSIGDAGFPALA